MSEETAAVKRPVGRPRKAPSINDLPEDQNNSIAVLETAVPEMSPNGDTELPEPFQHDPEAGGEDGFGLARSVGKKANDLIREKNTFEMEDPADPILGDLYHHGIELAGGDVIVSLLLREGYAESLRQEAEANGISLTAHAQRLLDWWIENEYALQAPGKR